MTNYQLHKLINYKLRERGLEEIKPQQIYNKRKGLDKLDGVDALTFIEEFVSNRHNSSNKKSVNPEEWFSQFVS